MNDREFIARVEAANTGELIQILSRPSPEEERVLRLHLGPERYLRLRQLALRSAGKRGVKKGNVVVLHGIMGGELTLIDKGKSQYIWLSYPRLILGAVGWLRMADGGKSIYDIRATGILKKWYAEMLLGLAAQDWNVQAFWYDWRRDLAESADALNDQINGWFGSNAPVHLVGHSMGGLVSRTFILRHAERWKRAWDSQGNGRAGGRLIMLGTPNHGSFAIPQICTGTEETIRKLVIADLKHDTAGLVGVVNTFPGSYQMLPSTAVMPAMEPLYHAKTYGNFGVPQALLDNARRHHEKLQPVVDRDRMIYVAGYNRRTYDNIHDMSKLASIDAYSASMNGDGTVPHLLGFLEQDGKRIPTYFADALHGELPNNASVVAATLQLLESGKCPLPATLPAATRGQTPKSAEAGELLRVKADEARLAEITAKTRVRTRGAEALEEPVSPDEKEAERIILRSFLGGGDDASEVPSGAPKSTGSNKAQPPNTLATIEIGLIKGDLETVAAKSTDGAAVDAIAVGHYLGVKPQAAEAALDRAVATALLEAKSRTRRGGAKSQPPTDADLILTTFTERGLIRGELAQPFFLPDPRDPGRVLVLAGMGTPGHFGIPELTVLAQELCWSLGRLGKLHLATVLIGAGTGNLSVPDAVGAWLRGIRRALGSSAQDVGHQLVRITFVERSARTLGDMDRALRMAVGKGMDGLSIRYVGPGDAALKQARIDARKDAAKQAEDEFDRGGFSNDSDESVPVRITVGIERKTYQFAAITQSASVPQRDIPLDPKLVSQANDELAGAGLEDQRQCGLFLERLLIPAEFRGTIYTPAPIVLMLDSTTARVHWEMIARSDPRDDSRRPAGGGAFDPDDFLGTSYGLTRQLRTTFAPPPEPPPPAKRVLRVLVVADPAEDAPLPGAQAEAEEVAATFERFNDVHFERTGHSVEVVRLFGPAEAKRTTVLKKLMLENFDVLHFAGHCVYDNDDPSNSGWLFSLKDDERLTANELRRIDRVPKFIFSNACESGITPDRSGQRSAGLAPSFAEAFFARGVANFVCTAWPVDDEAARGFAREFYSQLLGLIESDRFAPMHHAMREARRAIAASPGGSLTWGAYQHYGNPYFKLFENPPPTAVKRGGQPAKKKSPAKTVARPSRKVAKKRGKP